MTELKDGQIVSIPVVSPPTECNHIKWQFYNRTDKNRPWLQVWCKSKCVWRINMVEMCRVIRSSRSATLIILLPLWYPRSYERKLWRTGTTSESLKLHQGREVPHHMYLAKILTLLIHSVPSEAAQKRRFVEYCKEEITQLPHWANGCPSSIRPTHWSFGQDTQMTYPRN